MMVLVVQLFVVAFFLNLLWELVHSCLYETCLYRDHPSNVFAILTASLGDAALICAFYLVTVAVFREWDLFTDVWQVVFFLSLSVVVAIVGEWYSLRRGRWRYSRWMPVIFGIGLTPLVELGVTGIMALLILL